MKKTIYYIILLILIVLCALTFNSYFNGKNGTDTEIDNFYTSDYLFNNDYIVFANKLLDVESFNKEISDLPTNYNSIYYNQLNDYVEYIAITDNNDLYYANSIDKKFVNLGSNIVNVYVISDKVVNEGYSSFVVSDKDNNLKTIELVKNDYDLVDLETVKPYFDYICEDVLCSDFNIYITFNKELVYNNKKIEDKDGNTIFVSDIFGVLTIDSKKDVLLKDYSKYKYTYNLYAITEDSTLYIISKNGKDYSIEFLETKENISEVKYEKDENKVNKITIIYDNGSVDVFEKDKNKYLITSTLHSDDK